MTEKHESSQAFQPAIPPQPDRLLENAPEGECDCPAGWHLRSCDLVYWPEGMREEDGDE